MDAIRSCNKVRVCKDYWNEATQFTHTAACQSPHLSLNDLGAQLAVVFPFITELEIATQYHIYLSLRVSVHSTE